MHRRLLTPPARSHCRVHLLVLLALGLATASTLVAAADDELEEMVAAARPDAAEPPARPFAGPAPGGLYAPSDIIFPAQSLPLRFFHDKHVVAAKMACVDCHEQATTSTNAADRMLPPMSLCLECHALDEAFDNFPRPEGGGPPPADCTTCHVSYIDNPPEFDDDVDEIDEYNFMEVLNPPDLPKIPAPNIKFPHKDHVDAKIDCATCHGTMENVQLATRMNLPTMALCLTCHTPENDTPADRCGTCHLTQADGRIKTRFAESPTPGGAAPTPTATVELGNLTQVDPMLLNPLADRMEEGGSLVRVLMPAGRFRGDDHRLDYIEQHRHVAPSETAYCQSCHTESYCLDCHNGVVKPITVHPANYSQLHAIDAYNDQPECSSCHNRQDFCITCHQQVGLTKERVNPDFPRPAEAESFQYHPAGWVVFPGLEGPDGLRSAHAVAAQRNIGACASCHQESLCINCHSTQAQQPPANIAPINPHPANWIDRCGSLFQRNNTACLKCHVINDPLLGLCR